MKHKNLTVEIKEGVFSVSIGTEMLCNACEVGRRYGLGDIEITDKPLFIENFVIQIESEDADGGTLIHEMIDRAVTKMLENGERGVVLLEDLE